MSAYLLTPAADADLEEIWQYVSTNSSAGRADTLEEELHAAMRRLGAMPGIGHARGDLAEEPLRFLGVHPDVRPVQIVRVLHSARDVQAILSGDPRTPPGL